MADRPRYVALRHLSDGIRVLKTIFSSVLPWTVALHPTSLPPHISLWCNSSAYPYAPHRSVLKWRNRSACPCGPHPCDPSLPWCNAHVARNTHCRAVPSIKTVRNCLISHMTRADIAERHYEKRPLSLHWTLLEDDMKGRGREPSKRDRLHERRRTDRPTLTKTGANTSTV